MDKLRNIDAASFKDASAEIKELVEAVDGMYDGGGMANLADIQIANENLKKKLEGSDGTDERTT